VFINETSEYINDVNETKKVRGVIKATERKFVIRQSYFLKYLPYFKVETE